MKNIFLIGMPSSGKTTLGKELARHVRYRFVDTDRLIVKAAGMAINEIFAQKGEPHFRELERDILRVIRPNSKLVIATGGGMPCFFDNMDYIKTHGLSVFLDVPPSELYQRMKRISANERPLYNPLDEQLLTTLRQKHADRLSFYTQADISLSGNDLNVHAVLKAIAEN
ncbi:MAG: shikimate kinase [Runella slithyformis]|jgi:shikimate kinase|nr:MAG: shikimate kinase [Runella slithyformis]TAG23822.1 MAG: shikimate kinase [Cytophagales bacterium]TAG43255.1 MAG: shikimate kinase [Cytophagia bacterium]TAE90956.1 MAG: shikimate kinase [Runella slithyformis]TAF28346.1 MAG: shikimate kinase [Runella slithyformis]